jgi:hypothetical protein
MKEIGTIIHGFTWIFILCVAAAIVWVVRNFNPFPTKRLRNLNFDKVKIGQTFYDYGCEESKLREYTKTGELEARCLSVSGHPTVSFEEKNIVKVEVKIL